METAPASNQRSTTILDGLQQRRSVAAMLPDEPARDLIEQVIEAATWAPNHHRTAPWRFIVLTGRARQALGEVCAADARQRMTPPLDQQADAMLERERQKPLRAPVIIAVAAVPSQQPRIVESEEVAAVDAAVQNMLLAAEAVGLGAIWRTGDSVRSSAVKSFLGLPPTAHIVAFVYLGYPREGGRQARSGDARDVTTWLS